VGLDEEQNLQMRAGYTRHVACLHFGRCCPHKWTRRST